MKLFSTAMEDLNWARRDKAVGEFRQVIGRYGESDIEQERMLVERAREELDMLTPHRSVEGEDYYLTVVRQGMENVSLGTLSRERRLHPEVGEWEIDLGQSSGYNLCFSAGGSFGLEGGGLYRVRRTRKGVACSEPSELEEVISKKRGSETRLDLTRGRFSFAFPRGARIMARKL